MMALGAATAPAQTVGTAINGLLNPPHTHKTVRLGNVTANDFAELLGQRFYLQTNDGSAVHAKLIETSTPNTRRGLRFRREHFSIVFNVPDGLELFQGQYRLSHPRIGSMELFMVPVDLPATHRRLEAVFS